MNENLRRPVLKLLVVILDTKKIKKLTEFFKAQHVRLHYVCKGIGTASSEKLDLLGLGGIDRSISISLVPGFLIEQVIDLMSLDLKMTKHGGGIAFTIPLTGVSVPTSNLFSDEVKKIKERWMSHMENEAEKSSTEATFDLIIAIVNQGFSDDLMHTAKLAGARGGTIVNARRIGMEEAVKFFGISIQVEKEIIMILAKREIKKTIMQAINKSCGAFTEAKGVVFSLPVESTAGLNET